MFYLVGVIKTYLLKLYIMIRVITSGLIFSLLLLSCNKTLDEILLRIKQ